MEITFIVRYRRALRELQEACKLQYTLIDESDALLTLAYGQAQASEKAALKNRKSGRGYLISRLRECLDEESLAWSITQRIKKDIEEMEGDGYDSEVSTEQAHALYNVIEDAICRLLEIFGSQFPKLLTGAAIATYRGNIPVSELVLKFGPAHLQRIVRQRLKAAADSPGPETTEPPQPGSLAPPATPQPLDTPALPVSELATKPQRGENNLLDILCGGYEPEKLLKVIGCAGLGLYDATNRKPNDTATSTNWAMLYWGLQYKGFLPAGIRNAKAAELLKKTFGAKSSKTRIGDTKPDMNEKPKRGTYLARVVELLSELAA